jgi:activator of 2-hydroxyglutaryl-CoA dehydratase
VAATEAALEHVGGNFGAVASLGGEVFAIYLVERGRVVSVLSHNKCAAGSGEFLVQQIRRLGLALEEAVERVFAALPPSKVTLGLVVQIPAVAALTAAR